MPQDSCLPFSSCKTRYAVGTVGVAVKHLSCEGNIFRTGKQAWRCNYVLKALSERVGYIVVGEERTSVQLVPCVISYRNIGNQLFKRLFPPITPLRWERSTFILRSDFQSNCSIYTVLCLRCFYGERVHFGNIKGWYKVVAVNKGNIFASCVCKTCVSCGWKTCVLLSDYFMKSYSLANLSAIVMELSFVPSFTMIISYLYPKFWRTSESRQRSMYFQRCIRERPHSRQPHALAYYLCSYKPLLNRK